MSYPYRQSILLVPRSSLESARSAAASGDPLGALVGQAACERRRPRRFTVSGKPSSVRAMRLSAGSSLRWRGLKASQTRGSCADPCAGQTGASAPDLHEGASIDALKMLVHSFLHLLPEEVHAEYVRQLMKFAGEKAGQLIRSSLEPLPQG